MKHKRVLFILKRHVYGRSFGLANSCEFVAQALRLHHVDAKVVEVTDNNDIDRVVTQYNPTDVVIEALWVVPSKFTVLRRLHPKVRWTVRIHSNIPFLSGEGMAIEWIKGYSEFCGNVGVSCNSSELKNSLLLSLGVEADLLPNIYADSLTDRPFCRPPEVEKGDFIDVGCFGAIRPLKNQLQQAVAAMIYANLHDQRLRFHVNSTRVEQRADPVLKNLKSLFEGTVHKLVSHGWLSHRKFIEQVLLMDIGLQVSFSETFNIVSADFVYHEIPFVGSADITWLNDKSQALTTSYEDIVKKMQLAMTHPSLLVKNKRQLKQYSEESLKAWLHYLR